ncbi:MAG: Mini-ribonuclease 3 [Peptococcaceae bacterium]|nr:Mini-ribonuclease 3 [Peptococcaceae bacterium]
MLLDFTYEGRPAELPALTLAFVGDAVYELYVRQNILSLSVKAHNLHYLGVSRVNNNTQAMLLMRIEPELTEIEQSVVRRGRNAKGIVPKNAAVQTYRKSTALEALIGYLYLNGENERLLWILGQIEDVVAQGGH